MTISEESIEEGKLACGFDRNDEKIYGFMSFDLSNLPDINEIAITDAWIELRNSSTVKKDMDIRYNVEFIDLEEFSYQDIKNRERIEYIGYEVSSAELGKKREHDFIFDSFSILALEEKIRYREEAKFIIRPTSVFTRKHLINWANSGEKGAKLKIKYIERRRKPPLAPTNLRASVEKGVVKLTWDRVNSKDVVGYYVVRNRWHTPSNPFDGVKLYAGKDGYTYDTYGSTKLNKYYALFSYDNVPNYSEGVVISYSPKGK
jgi:hypothetical protein